MKKNPFRGLAVPMSHPKLMRHIEGARDTRPVHPTHYRDQAIRSIVNPAIVLPTHRDTNPHPVAFLP